MKLKPPQMLAMISLYQRELENHLRPLYSSQENVGCLKEFLPSGEISKIADEADGPDDFCVKLLNSLRESPLKNRLYDALLNFLKLQDPNSDLLKWFALSADDNRRSQFNAVLMYYDEFMQHLNVKKTIQYLKLFSKYTQIVAALENNFHLNVESPEANKKNLVENDPATRKDFSLTLPDITVNSAMNRDFPRRIYYCPVEESMTDFMRHLDLGTTSLNPRYSEIDFNWEGIPERDNYERDFHLRSDWLRKKTVVAAKIIKSHLDFARSEGRRAKVLFMTPNSHRYRTSTIQGAANSPVLEVIKSHDLVLSTPQMIVNLCEPTVSDSLGKPSEVFYISTFSLIVFDECHRTQKKEPYSMLMRFYHEIKNKVVPEGHVLPQIVGLTASLGVGNAKSDIQACEFIARICANMDCKEISTVRRNLGELASFSPYTPDECELVEKKSKIVSGWNFADTLTDMMKNFELRMADIIRIESISLSCSVAQKYGQWVNTQLRYLPEVEMEKDVKTRITEVFEILRLCHITLLLDEDFNSLEAYNVLKMEMEARKATLTQEALQIWEGLQNRLSSLSNSENEILRALESQLIDQHLKKSDFRCIIFVQTRQGVNILKRILNGSQKLAIYGISADCISGINRGSSAESSSFSRQSQKEVLESFEKGEKKVLIATSVAEEGLDVAKCNLVIKYNYATNVIAHVQRRGRGREIGSRCILITNKKELKAQEEQNRMRENIMNAAIARIQNCDFDLENEVEKLVLKKWEEILFEDKQSEKRVACQAQAGVLYEILCKKCNKKLCTNQEVRKSLSQYVVCKNDFWNKVRTFNLSPAELERDQRFGSVGKIRCNGTNCSNALGRIVLISEVRYPCISASDIVLRFEADGSVNRKVVKKWKEIEEKFFTPQPLSVLDKQIMRGAMPTVQATQIETFDVLLPI
ncbi:unnamed protein product [Caenorhabditis auriculariae]|uniref:RNA helicase n=1 Tax=Caenorhabditis auriculariae TaxID=2777116 RepID=A0A8S1HWV9_9PELO|nr:unnamed protein product [Caenorhabditis auriculariae]